MKDLVEEAAAEEVSGSSQVEHQNLLAEGTEPEQNPAEVRRPLLNEPVHVLTALPGSMQQLETDVRELDQRVFLV